MAHIHTVRRLAAAASLMLATTASQAGPVTLQFNGSVTGYYNGDLSGFAPVGTAAALTLNFNETFSDGSYDFSDNLGPVSGGLTVGSASVAFDGFQAYVYSGGQTLVSVSPYFTGSGDAPAGASLFGLFMTITPALTVQGPLRLGYGFTTSFSDGSSTTSYRYVEMEGSSSIVPTGTVPAPATLPLVAMSLLIAGWAGGRAAANR
ncbi:MAG: hypothetical protein Q7U73_13575 [Rubrivivax sp.]|nr:hypothetical protein [Rubrivivax sp.]